MKIYTRKGDDGTTGLLFGGRVTKDSASIVANGDIDETQAVLGLARANAVRGSELDTILIGIERDLWVLMAEVATADENRHKLIGGQTKVTGEMVASLESLIDSISDRFEPPTEFVVPGESPEAAMLDLARTVTRRAERSTLAAASGWEGSHVLEYLNRLSDLLWTLARWQEGTSRLARDQ